MVACAAWVVTDFLFCCRIFITAGVQLKLFYSHYLCDYWTTAASTLHNHILLLCSCWLSVIVRVPWWHPNRHSASAFSDVDLETGFCDFCVIVCLFIVYTGCGLKNDPTPKMWLLSNSWKFLRQILYTCWEESCPLMFCFSRKLLYIYEIDVMPNFKFEFCICTSLFFTWCYIP